MAAQPDFWGDIRPVEIHTPADIMGQQAVLLGPKTQNTIEAVVETVAIQDAFRHSFNLVVPRLHNYTYELFSVRHNADFYPAWVESGKELRNEEEFTEWLHQKLSAPETKKILRALFTQVGR